MQQPISIKLYAQQRNCDWLWRFVMASILSLSVMALSPRGAKAAFDCNNFTEIPVVECEALVVLYTSTGGPDWVDQGGWLITPTPCSWRGITCSRSQHVIGIYRGFNGLVGKIPGEIGNLSTLLWLILENNQLSGLPPEIGRLTSLIHIDLTNNQLSNLPPEFGNLSTLRSLGLYGNQLSSLPPEFGRLTNLTGINLSNNQLSSLPPEFGNLTNLDYVYITDNQLSSLPPEFGRLTNLTDMDLSNNQLSSLPPEIGGLTSLILLELSNNQLSSLPPEIGSLVNLTFMDLPNNQLSSLPPEIGGLTKLDYMNLSNNQLSSLPPEIGNLSHLVTLDLNNNQLSSLPPEFGNLSVLEFLQLTNNQLSGLPPEFSGLTSLIHIDLSNNQLSSPPPVIGNLSTLRSLDLHGNRTLAGPLPVSLLGLRELQRFSFAETNLCEPGDATFQDWLARIVELHSTEVICPDVTHMLRLDRLRLRYWPIPTIASPVGIIELRTTLRNTSTTPISSLYFYVSALSGNNLLLNGDLGPLGVGNRLTVPPGTLGPDGVLGPSETVFVSFRIGLQQLSAFTFVAPAYGVLPEGVSAATADGSQLRIEVTADELEASRQYGSVYLPWLNH